MGWLFLRHWNDKILYFFLQSLFVKVDCISMELLLGRVTSHSKRTWWEITYCWKQLQADQLWKIMTSVYQNTKAPVSYRRIRSLARKNFIWHTPPRYVWWREGRIFQKYESQTEGIRVLVWKILIFIPHYYGWREGILEVK